MTEWQDKARKALMEHFEGWDRGDDIDFDALVKVFAEELVEAFSDGYDQGCWEASGRP